MTIIEQCLYQQPEVVHAQQWVFALEKDAPSEREEHAHRDLGAMWWYHARHSATR
ncbi:MAG: hypothetical protein IPP17_29910 [Bacteroidetes bacterium]|nr:hypothetical protein [Bacteroidota bacterium]